MPRDAVSRTANVGTVGTCDTHERISFRLVGPGDTCDVRIPFIYLFYTLYFLYLFTTFLPGMGIILSEKKYIFVADEFFFVIIEINLFTIQIQLVTN